MQQPTSQNTLGTLNSNPYLNFIANQQSAYPNNTQIYTKKQTRGKLRQDCLDQRKEINKIIQTSDYKCLLKLDTSDRSTDQYIIEAEDCTSLDKVNEDLSEMSL